jgi:hypothetical protein
MIIAAGGQVAWQVIADGPAQDVPRFFLHRAAA